MQRTCVKCGAKNPNASGDDAEACPACGVIYAKANTAPLQRPAAGRAASSASGFSASGYQRSMFDGGPGLGLAAFVERMRAESLYPTVRMLVRWTHYLVIAIAVVVLLGGIKGTFTHGPLALVLGLVLAVILVLASLAARELSLMLADLSDATVRTAAAAESRT